jgi:hypothetical protein
MQAAIEAVVGLADSELDGIGGAARAWFLDNDRAFADRLDAAIHELE